MYVYTEGEILAVSMSKYTVSLYTANPLAAPLQIDTSVQISVTKQIVVILVKITKTDFLAQESLFKQAAANAGGVDVSKVEFISIEEIQLRCVSVWQCSFFD